eukprot:3221008-Amphidinium_carterae.1
MLGLMEPEQLAPFGYEVQDSLCTKVRVQPISGSLDTSANTTMPVNHIKLVNDRKVEGVVTTLMFVLASGQAPVRAAASSVMQTTTTTTSVVLPPLTAMLASWIALLLSITTLVRAVSNRMRMSPMNATTRVTQ